MRGLATLSVLVAILSLSWGRQHYYEFGFFNNYDKVLEYSTGKIGFLEKHKRIKLEVPNCAVVTYVGVAVDNDDARPTVDFNRETNTVIIKYGFLEHSKSTYSLHSRGYDIPGCDSSNLRPNNYLFPPRQRPSPNVVPSPNVIPSPSVFPNPAVGPSPSVYPNPVVEPSPSVFPNDPRPAVVPNYYRK